MTDNSHRTLERIARRVPIPESAYERFLRRRDRKQRNRRVSAAVLAIVLTSLSVTALMRAFGNSGRPATQPTPTPVGRGLFSGMGGWIAYGSGGIIQVMDPEQPGVRKQLSTHIGEPLAWSSDGSKLLVGARQLGPQFEHALYVLNADGSETHLIDAGAGRLLAGGSFSPDASEVVFADLPSDSTGDAGIYVVDADGGSPRRLLQARLLPAYGPSVRSMVYDPTFSPDGSQIAYFDGLGDHDNTLRVMNADGSGSHVLLKDAGVMRGAGLVNLTWSPDGSRLAFGAGYGPSRHRSIYTVGADGSGLTRLKVRGADPQWSADGSRIAYLAGWRQGRYVMEIANADGTHVQRFDYAVPGPWNPLARAKVQR